MLMCLVSCQSQTPYIGENGNWWVGNHDLGVAAQGYNQEDALSVPEIAKVLTQSTVIVRSKDMHVESLGTGFIVSENGYIVTLYGIVDDSRSTEIIFSNGQIVDGEIVAYNEAENIAIIKVEGSFTAAPIGNCDNLLQGSPVYCVGAQNNTLVFSQGVISATESVFSHIGSEYAFDTKVLLTDASFGDVNCGVLANQDGKIIGLVFGMNTISSIHYVLPINVITEFVEYAKATENCNNVDLGNTKIRPIIGISTSTIKKGNTNFVGTLATSDGVIVGFVDPDGFAEGVLQINDIIYEVDGIVVSNVDQLYNKLYDYRLGQAIHLKIDRLGELLEVDIYLSKKETN